MFNIIETLGNCFSHELQPDNLSSEAAHWHFTLKSVSGSCVWQWAVQRKCFAGHCCPCGFRTSQVTGHSMALWDLTACDWVSDQSLEFIFWGNRITSVV